MYANIVEPIVALTRKATPWGWGDREQQAFDTLKHAVLDSPILKHPEQDKPFIVVTDASDYAVGASLEQNEADDKRRPCLFFSHSMNEAERKYPVHERELLANSVLFVRLTTSHFKHS
jgi:hypothetical protein